MIRYFKILRDPVIRALLVLAIIVIALPPRAKSRVVILAKTQVVLPTGEGTVYSIEYFRKYEDLINQASDEFDVPVPLIAAVIKAESDFDPYARSHAGARGLMQLMPATWAELGGIGSPYNAGMNIRLGTKYLRELMDQFRGNLRLTIAAYNAGPGAVKKFRRVPPYRETRRYVPKVLAYYREYKRIMSYLSIST